MTQNWKARAEYDYRYFNTGIFLAKQSGDYTTVFDFSSVTSESHPTGEAVNRDTAHDPRLMLPEEAARALYDALGEMYGFPANNAQSLRKDYEHEKKRVDKFIDKLIKD